MAYERRKPAPVIIRKDGEEKVVPADHFPRRKTLAAYAPPNVRVETITPWELLAEQELLALRPGAPIAITDDRDRLRWFVRAVDGTQRLITAATLVFDQPHQRTVPFELVEPIEIPSEEKADVDRAIRIIDQRLGRVRG